jgi:hypothetical protein
MITAKIYFEKDLIRIRAEDVLDGYNPVGQWSDAAEGDYAAFSCTDIGGVATVDIYGTDTDETEHYRRVSLHHGDSCDFPLEEPTIQNELAPRA